MALGYFVFGPYGAGFNKEIDKNIIDSEICLGREYVVKCFELITQERVSRFVYLHVIDSFFALSYSILLWSVLVRIFLMKLNLGNSFLTAFGLFGGMFDILENISLIIMAFLTQHSINFKRVCIGLMIFTPAKFILLFLAVILIVAGITLIVVRKGKETWNY
ncbi:MAG: hypothetical protein WHS64_09965 [Fervidobacterium sp.]|uniref:hypothetical protein n=1 Tax=Fervidobacterium sp. TaxID=1871331 RepID=UPI0030A6770D